MGITAGMMSPDDMSPNGTPPMKPQRPPAEPPGLAAAQKELTRVEIPCSIDEFFTHCVASGAAFSSDIYHDQRGDTEITSTDWARSEIGTSRTIRFITPVKGVRRRGRARGGKGGKGVRVQGEGRLRDIRGRGAGETAGYVLFCFPLPFVSRACMLIIVP